MGRAQINRTDKLIGADEFRAKDSATFKVSQDNLIALFIIKKLIQGAGEHNSGSFVSLPRSEQQFVALTDHFSNL